jgi:spore coat polysaccharide biosynthesis protein SpsF
LGYVIDRCKYFGIIPIVCTSTDPRDNAIEDYCKEEKIQYFRGSLNNKLKRWYDCANSLGISKFHTIDCDDPFFDPDLVNESLEILDSIGVDVVFPTEISSTGTASVGFSIRTEVLSKIEGIDDNSLNTEMVDQIFSQSSLISTQELVTQKEELEGIRLTLDYPEDYILIRALDLLSEGMPSRDELRKIIDRNPDLRRINGFRTVDWANNQEKIRNFQVRELQ